MYVKIIAVEGCWHTGLAVAPGLIEKPAYVLSRKVSEMKTNGVANSSGEAAPGLPRYAQVANDLMERIASGEYPIGSLLPKEVDLSAEYRISRHTMREALRRLDEAGLVSRRRRAGTEVLAATPAASYRQPINSIDDLLQY